MKLILTLLGTAFALWIAVWLVDGFEFEGEWWQFLIIAGLVGLANAVIRPIAKLISLPFMIVTLGLFAIVINAVLLQVVVWLSGPDLLDLGLTSDGFFWSTVLASIVVSIAGAIIGIFIPDDGRLGSWT